MADLIDRKSAIDSIEKHLRFVDELYPLTETDRIMNHAFEIAASCVYNLPSAQPDLDEWCTDCKEYDQEKHCCPRWNRVIRKTAEEVRQNAEPRWIPVTERLPEKRGEYLVTYHPCYWDDVESGILVGIDTFRGKTTWAQRKYQRVTAWMPLPKPYERSADE